MTRARSVLLALIALLYVASWPGSALRPRIVEVVVPPVPQNLPDRDGALDVTVTTEEGDVVQGARVRAFAILDGRAHAAGAALTDGEGRARLGDLPRAEHWIVAEADGYARASQMVVVVAGARRVDLMLAAEHSLDVEVRSEGGEPIANAEIEVRAADPFPIGARADAGGRVRVGRLGEGPYVVVVRAPGYEETVRRRVTEGTRLVVTLGRHGALLVSVLTENGEPAAGARVLLASPSLWPARVTETGADGTVRVGGLDSGSYALRAVLGTRVSPIEIGVSVAKGEEKGVELRLGPGLTVSLHVVDAVSDEDVSGARITLAEGGLSPFPIEGVSDKHGRATLGPIARGDAAISVRAEGFVQKTAVKVPDPPPPELKVALVRGGVLTGRVRDARGFPVDGATVRVVGTDIDGMPIDEDPRRTPFREAHFTAMLAGPTPLVAAGELGVVPGPVPPIPRGPPVGLPFASGAPNESVEPWITGRDGTFRAAPIPPGRARALVEHPEYVEAASALVVITPDKEAHVEVILLRGAILEGRVVDRRGRSIAGAQVTILATRGSLERMTRTASDGTFAFAAVPDTLTLLVSRGEDVLEAATRLELGVPEGGRKTVEVVLSDPRPPLPVLVMADRRTPIDAAQVSATSLDANEGLRATAFTNARGEANLEGAQGLPLRVEVKAPGRASKIVVTTSETTSLTVELGTAERLSGEIWKNRRETIEGAEVLLQTETGTRRGRTDSVGVFSIDDLAAGPAHLRVRAPGYAPLERAVAIESRGGRATELGRLELAEEGVIEGVVVDGRGDPVAGARVGKDSVPTYLPVGATPSGMALTDAKGQFRLGELAAGNVTLEAYAPDVGRARVGGVRVTSGRTTDRVRIVLGRADETSSEPLAAGGVAVTLGETGVLADGAPEVVVVAVSEGSEAERAGLLAGDTLLEVAGTKVRSIPEARSRLSGPLHDDVVVRVRRGEQVLVLRIARERVRR